MYIKTIPYVHIIIPHILQGATVHPQYHVHMSWSFEYCSLLNHQILLCKTSIWYNLSSNLLCYLIAGGYITENSLTIGLKTQISPDLAYPELPIQLPNQLADFRTEHGYAYTLQCPPYTKFQNAWTAAKIYGQTRLNFSTLQCFLGHPHKPTLIGPGLPCLTRQWDI